MKIRSRFSWALWLLAAAGCAHHEETTRTVPTAPDNKRAELADGQIAAIIDSANRGAIAVSELAKTNATSPDIKSLASNAVTDLTTLNNDLLAVIQKNGIATSDSDANKDLMSSINDDLKKLHDAKPVEFDKAYINAVIDESKKLIDLIDNKLLPNAKNPDLLQKIRELRPKIAKRLMDAQQIQPSVAAR